MRVSSVCLAVLGCGLALQAAEFTGRWKGAIVSPEGGRREYEFVLKLGAKSVTGLAGTPQGNFPIVSGEVLEDEIRFVAERSPGRTVTYRARMIGEELHAFVPAEVVLYRASLDPIPAPPPPISLPALGRLPGNGLAKTPPLGWNSWNKFHTRISDVLVREIADAMVSSGMQKAGYSFINIDDGWEGTRDGSGNIRSNTRFPNMKALADYVHSKGLKLGLYSSPGPRTCAGFEGSFNHEAQDARTFAAWGVDYLKYDWCTAAKVYTDEQMRAAYQKMGEALQATGRPIVFSLCQYGRERVETWGALAGGNLWRTTGDIGDRWASLSQLGFDKQAGLEAHAGPGRWNDPDMLEVGNGGMSDAEYRTHMSLWAMLAAPLMAGNDLRQMTPATLEILTNAGVLAVDQDALGKQGKRVGKKGDVEVWLRELSGGEYAVAVFNRGESAAGTAVKWAELGISGPFRLLDLWASAPRAATPDGFSADVPAHGVVMVRLRR